MCVVMTTKTLRLPCRTPVNHRIHTARRTHTNNSLLTHETRFSCRGSHCSHSRALPFSALSTTIIVSTPFPALLRLCSQRDVTMETGWKLMGLKRHDWHTHSASARTHAEVRACGCTGHTHFAHSLLCATLRDAAYYYCCTDMHT